MLFYILIHLYWIGAAIAACTYLSLWLNDRETPFSDTTSWIVLGIATLLWPLVLPISLKTELLPRLQTSLTRSPGQRMHSPSIGEKMP